MSKMIQKMQQLKNKKGRKGFTLIEVIVVLVIIAILAAIAVPALTGYIDKANQRASISQAAVVRTALQSIASDSYKTGGSVDLSAAITGGSSLLSNVTGYSPISSATTVAGEVTALTGNTVANNDLQQITWTNNVVSGFTLKVGDFYVTFANSSYTVSKSAPGNWTTA